jgi:phenylacetic acid degradation operon negative regulatory protein
VAPRPSAELADILAAENVTARLFHGEHDGDDADLAARAWDLETLGADYAGFVTEWLPIVSAVDGSRPAEAFAASQRLLHAWRKFLFRDPGLPEKVLPKGWAGTAAAEFFDEHTARLAPAAESYLAECLSRGGRARSSA